MSISPKLPAAFSLAFATSLSASVAPHPSPANVIVVLPDQWRGQAFGFAGDSNVRTPNLDQLARESVNCINAVAGMPVCCPTRASLMTGQRPLTHGVFLNDVALHPNAATLAEMMTGSGFDTAYIGKWHLNGPDRSAAIPPNCRLGFGYWKAAECTHDYQHSSYIDDSGRRVQWPGYDAVAQTDDAVAYLRQHAADRRPFFLVLAWGPPHSPYATAPAPYRGWYSPGTITLRKNVEPAMQGHAREMLANYYAHCSALDACMGQLRQALQQLGLENDTLLIFTSDHGDMLGSHGARDKQQPYEESIRIPLLFHWPAGLANAPPVRDAVIASEDFMPTLLGLCGLTAPAAVEGRDYSDYLRGGVDVSDGTALLSCVAPFGQWSRRVGGREYRGLRTRRYTYVRDLRGPWLLFDNRTDPYQLENLVGRPEVAGLQAELDAALNRKLTETHDKFLPGAAYVRQWGYTVDRDGTVPYTE